MKVMIKIELHNKYIGYEGSDRHQQYLQETTLNVVRSKLHTHGGSGFNPLWMRKENSEDLERQSNIRIFYNWI